MAVSWYAMVRNLAQLYVITLKAMSRWPTVTVYARGHFQVIPLLVQKMSSFVHDYKIIENLSSNGDNLRRILQYESKLLKKMIMGLIQQ